MPAIFPYPGLRPFLSSETNIFFGREEQTDDLLEKLSETRFLGIVGPSGCGKSSLVLAGMIPALEAGFMVTAGSRWLTARMRPGDQPLRALADALLKTGIPGLKTGENPLAELEETLREGPKGLVEVLRKNPLPEHTNLLLLVDQFEELFRFRNEQKEQCRDEQEAFVALLLESAAETGVSIYVVITMRSDYLSDCAIFRGLPEALNRSQYLTPRLTRDQLEEAITGPARVFGGDIEPALLNRLLNETGSDPNQLPVLQHLLMRLWSTTKSSRALSQPNPFFFDTPPENLGHLLTLADYESLGGLTEALSRHADQAFDQLDSEQKKIAEILFRTICERGSALRDGRHPTSVEVIAERAGVSPDTIIGIVEIFRSPSFGFLAPSLPDKLRRDSKIDISHESLIKLWKRLGTWVDAEAKAAQNYHLLELSARSWKAGEASLWSALNLETALAWKEREHPTAAWAERYGGNFQLALEFLEASVAKKRADDAEAEAQRQEKLHKTQRWLRLSISAVVAGILAITLYAYLFVIPYHSYSRNFTKRWGVFYPIGPLNEDAVRHRSWTFRLTSRGRINPVVQSVEVIDSKGELTPYIQINTYLSDPDKIMQGEKPVRYEFVYDKNGNVVYEISWDRFNRRSWTFVHIPYAQKPSARAESLPARWIQNLASFLHLSSGQHETVSRGFFVDADGFPKPQGHSLAEIVEIEYDEHGFEKKLTYYDRTGRAQPGPDNAYGVALLHDDEGREIRRTSLDRTGKPINDDAGNAGLEKQYDRAGNLVEARAFDAQGKPTLVITEARAFDAQGKPTLVITGWCTQKLQYDRWGNNTEISYFGLSGEPVIETDESQAHKVKCVYDDKGNGTSISYFGPSGEPLSITLFNTDFSGTLVHEKRYTYRADNRVVSESYFDTSGKPVSSQEGLHRWYYEYDRKGFIVARTTLGINGAPVLSQQGYARTGWVNDSYGRVTEERYFAINHKPVTNPEGYHCKRTSYDRAGNVIRERWFDVHDQPVSSRSYGVPCIVRTYDLFNHCLTEQLSDASGNPVNGSRHFSITKNRYNDLGMLRAKQWFDKDETPCNGPDGVHQIKYQHDPDETLLTREQRFDSNRKPATGSDGIHETVYAYNDKRQITKVQRFGLNGTPVEGKDGDHLIEWQYDEKGRQVSYRRLRADGSANVDRDLGIAGWSKRFNQYNQWTEHVFYDAKNHPVIGPQGYARGVCVYSGEGDVTIYSFGADGKLNFNRIYGCAIKLDGSRLTAYYGTDRRLITGPYGYAEERRLRDRSGKLIALSWFGDNGKATVGAYGFHRIEQSPDGKTMRLFDTENHQITDPAKYPLVALLYIEQIIDVQRPAYRIGLSAGDVLWNYGHWSLPLAVSSALENRITADQLFDFFAQSFRNELARQSGAPVSMTVLRDGHPVNITVPPLSGKALGIQLGLRKVPPAQLQQLQKGAP